MPSIPPSHGEKSVHAYNRMMERVKDALKQTEKNTMEALRYNIDLAKEKAVELGELSREEAARIGDYLRRDLEDAGEYLADSGSPAGGIHRRRGSNQAGLPGPCATGPASLRVSYRGTHHRGQPALQRLR